MEIRAYYQKLRQAEATLTEAHAVMVSLATPDGGRAGVLTETPKAVAAKLIVDGGARVATPEEAAEFREQMTKARLLAEQAAAASRIQVTVVSQSQEEAKKSKAELTKSRG